MTCRYYILFSVMLVMIGCKKYAEDEENYYRTPCGRIARKWELYKITGKGERDFSDSVIYYKIPDNNWAIEKEQSFTFRGLILDFKRSGNRFCLETGIRGTVNVITKPYGTGYYEIRKKRTTLKFDIRPHERSPDRYFIDDYSIIKMTSEELIFEGRVKAYFKAVE